MCHTHCSCTILKYFFFVLLLIFYSSCSGSHHHSMHFNMFAMSSQKHRTRQGKIQNRNWNFFFVKINTPKKTWFSLKKNADSRDSLLSKVQKKSNNLFYTFLLSMISSSFLNIWYENNLCIEWGVYAFFSFQKL